MKFLTLYGSPRKNGNSSTLANQIVRGIRDAGKQCVEFYLHGMNINPCSACDSCQRNNDFKCVIEDDMHTIYAEVPKCDVLILASPIYCCTFSAQLKLFMDRCYALWRPSNHLLEGKKIVLVLTYGAEDVFVSGGINAIRTVQDAYKFYGSEVVDIIHCNANKIGDVNRNTRIMETAYALGKKLCENNP